MSKQTIYVIHKDDITTRLFSVYKKYATKSDKLSPYYRGYAQALEWVLDVNISTIITSTKPTEETEVLDDRKEEFSDD
tara:strand:+ start:443 stop:676 length:234 start_codon:yes stop_codon:yes gene_type:complete